MTSKILLLMVLMVILAILVINQIEISLSEKLQIGIAFAGLVTAGAVLATVFEMGKARTESNKPYLVCNLWNVYGYNRRNTDTSYLPSIWSRDEISVTSIKRIASRNPIVNDLDNYCGYLTNIGRGAAKKVHTKWKFDMLHSLGIFEEYANAYETEVKVHKKSKDRITINIDGANHKIVVREDDLKYAYTHVLISSDDEQCLPIPLPFSYVKFTSLIINMHISMFSKAHELIKNIPKLHLELSYKDISGMNHIQKYSFILNVMQTTFGKSTEDCALIFKAKFMSIE